jgi:predicted nucleic acid-binding protein
MGGKRISMELAETLTGKIVFFDSPPFIYVFEEKQPYKKLLEPVFYAVDNGTIRAVSSRITVIEVLTKPYRFGQWNLAERYREVFSHQSNIGMLSLTQKTADLAAQIRGKHGLKTPDAIQWATAMLHKVDYFLTNDQGFKIVNDDRILIIDDFL